MVDFSLEAIEAHASVKPLQLQKKLTNGSPVEITDLANKFATAAGDTGYAQQLQRRATNLTQAGYTNDGVGIPLNEAARTGKELGGNKVKLGSIARKLNAISNALQIGTNSANKAVNTVRGELQTIAAQYNRAVGVLNKQTAGGGPDAVSPAERAAERARLENFYRQQAVNRVNIAGQSVQTAVRTYEGQLRGAQTALAALGYVPPGGLNTGPGSVLLDPNAGTTAGTGARALVLGAPNSASAARFGQQTSVVNLLNQKLAARGQLTPAEKQYLSNFYNALGKDGLTKLPAWAGKAASLAKGGVTATSITRPVANGILNLYNPAKNGFNSIKDTPNSPIASLVADRVGYPGPNGTRVPSREFLAGNSAAPEGGYSVVTGVAEYGGFASLLASADPKVAGGDTFSTELAHSAVQFKKDVDQIRHDIHDGGANPPRALDAQLGDKAASDILGVVSHNSSASANVLIDADLRHAILGEDWQHDTGAADVVNSGTKRLPNDNSGLSYRHAQAALAVIQDVGAHDDQYLATAGNHLKAAIVTTGAQYTDAFAENPPGGSGIEANDHNLLGKGIGYGLDIDLGSRKGFLEFVGGSGYATAFQSAAFVDSRNTIAAALQTGDSHVIGQAVAAAGRLDGLIHQSYVEQYTEEYRNTVSPRQLAEHRADLQRNLLIKTGVSTVTAAGAAAAGAAVTVASGGAGIPLAVGLVSAGVNFAIFNGVQDPQAPDVAAYEKQVRDQQIDSGAVSSRHYRDVLLLSAAEQVKLPGIDYNDQGVRGVLDSASQNGVPNSNADAVLGSNTRLQDIENKIPRTKYGDNVFDLYKQYYDNPLSAGR